jgi:hypothetical protein
MWVEWTGRPETGPQTVSIWARDVRSGGEKPLDSVLFYPFNGIVVGMLGEDFGLGNPPNSGVAQLVENLYDAGWDAHLFEEPDGEDYPGKGELIDAEAEILNAVSNRGVVQVGLFGHSHGGAAVHLIATDLQAQLAGRLTYCAYIDAIQLPVNNNNALTVRPPGTLWLTNFYQTTNSIIHGAPVPGANSNTLIPNIGHTDIDDDPFVLGTIFIEIMNSVSR